MFPGIPGIDDVQDQNHGEYVATLKDRFRKSYTIVRQHLKAVAFRNKIKYNQRVKKRIKYIPGDWVWVFYPRRVQVKLPKWQRYYDGPLLVLEAIGDVNYRVQRSVHSKKQVVHVDKLKRYFGTTPLPWPSQPVVSGINDLPIPLELTFEDAFFDNLPESYEPWLVGEDPGDGLIQGDDVRMTPPDDGPVEGEEDEDSIADGSDTMSPLPAATINRPRRTVVKPARFRTVEVIEEMPGQAHATLSVDAKDLANEPEEIRPVQLAAIDTCEDNIVVEAVPEIDCEFGEEPFIELPSYY